MPTAAATISGSLVRLRPELVCSSLGAGAGEVGVAARLLGFVGLVGLVGMHMPTVSRNTGVEMNMVGNFYLEEHSSWVESFRNTNRKSEI